MTEYEAKYELPRRAKTCPRPGKTQPHQARNILIGRGVQVVQCQCILHVDLHSYVCTFNSAEEPTPLVINVGLTVSYKQLE